jgi:hypothetical protein
LLDVDYGLYVGIAVSLFMVVIRDKFFQIRNLKEYSFENNFVDEKFVIVSQHNETVCSDS